MLLPFVAALAPGVSTGMRPDVGRAGLHGRISNVAQLLSEASGARESMSALQAASGVVDTIMAETSNATEHMSDDDASLLKEVIDLIEKAIYGSMDSAHTADEQALAAGVAAVEECNAKITARQSPAGDLGKLHQDVSDDQTELNRLQGVVDDETSKNASAWATFDNHMQMISDPPACPGFPARTMPALDIYFEKSEYAVWFAHQADDYADKRSLYVNADAALAAAIEAYNIQKAIRDTQYCDWKNELETACDAFDKCFKEKSDDFNKRIVPRVQGDMDMRIKNFKAGETLVHQIKFLLAEVTDQETPSIATGRFELDFPSLPSKAVCDLSVLDSSAWVPVVECGRKYCLHIVTGTGDHNDGHLTVVVDGSELQTLVDGSHFSKGDVVIAGDTCFEKPIREIRVTNPGNNAWSGFIEYSSDEGQTFLPMHCIGGCNFVGAAANIVVDGNEDGQGLAGLECLVGKTCTLVPQAAGPHCLRAITDVSDNDNGHMQLFVDGVEFLDGHQEFHKGDVVVAEGTCFSQPIGEIRVVNPGNNAWSGDIEYSSDAGQNYQPMHCIGGCNFVGPADDIVVDGNTDGETLARLQCLSGKTCALVPRDAGPHCLRAITGTTTHDDGHVQFFVDGVHWLDGDKAFAKGDVVVAEGTCFQSPIQEITVQNTDTNAWAGTIEYSSDGGASFRPVTCTSGCNQVGPADELAVDGNTDGDSLADVHCLNGAACTLTP